ncbi:MAG: GNAT family N-acetyltransferase [Cyanobacteria bacterium P01_G01_bin.54]
MSDKINFRQSTQSDLPILEEIRQKAFEPVFDSFRSILGDQIYFLAQEPEDSQQGQLLSDMFLTETVWQVYVVELSDEVVGFVSIRMDSDSKVGEVGLNAVHPDHSGQGIGTEMYKFAINQMKRCGMQVATVATGGDPSHEPARRAYAKSGFNVQIPSVWMCQIL